MGELRLHEVWEIGESQFDMYVSYKLIFMSNVSLHKLCDSYYIHVNNADAWDKRVIFIDFS